MQDQNKILVTVDCWQCASFTKSQIISSASPTILINTAGEDDNESTNTTEPTATATDADDTEEGSATTTDASVTTTDIVEEASTGANVAVIVLVIFIVIALLAVGIVQFIRYRDRGGRTGGYSPADIQMK